LKFFAKIFTAYLAKVPLKRGLGESATTKLLRYLAEIHQRKFVIFQESQKTGGKNGLKMAVYRGTYFEWVAKAEEKRR